jgi:hypothetical protein
MKAFWSVVSFVVLLLFAVVSKRVGQEVGNSIVPKPTVMSEKEIDNDLEKAATDIRKMSTKMIDNITRLDGATSLGNRQFRYEYSLVGVNERSAFSILDEQNASSIEKAACIGKGTKKMLSTGITLIYKYSLEINPAIQIPEIVVTPGTCTKLANSKSHATNPSQNMAETTNLTEKDIVAPVSYKQKVGHEPIWSPIDLGKSNQLYYDARSMQKISDTTFTINYLNNEPMSDSVRSTINWGETIDCSSQSSKPGSMMLFASDRGNDFIEEIKVKSGTPFSPIKQGFPPAFIQAKLCDGPKAK